MGEVIPINLNRASLEEIAFYVKSLDRSNSVNCWHIAESLAQAKDICEDEGESWREYVDSSVGYDQSTADRYVRVGVELSARGRELAEKGCSFSTLKALAARDLKPSDRKRLIDKMVKKKSIDQKYGVEIQQEVRALIAPKLLSIKEVSHRFVWPDFEDRLAEVMASDHESPEKAARLLGLDIHVPPSDIRIAAKHWKQKYHPDKGGSTEEFDAICRAEEIFIAHQKEKEAAQ